MFERSVRNRRIQIALTGARVAGILALGTLALSGSASSQTITPQNVNPGQHFLDCLGVLFNSPVHAANCDPGHTVFVSGSTGSGPAGSPSDDTSDGDGNGGGCTDDDDVDNTCG
jgi:hypothetical protein